MPPAQAHAHEDDTDGSGGTPSPDGPLDPADVDRVLAESAGVGPEAPADTLREWRDELTDARASLLYARTVLGGDVAILRRCLSPEGGGAEAVIGTLPAVLSESQGEQGGTALTRPEVRPEIGPDVDPDVVVRADMLLSAHGEMARVDLASGPDAERVRRLIERQLSEVDARLGAVESRLVDIRTAIVRQYKDGVFPSLDRPA